MKTSLLSNFLLLSTVTSLTLSGIIPVHSVIAVPSTRAYINVTNNSSTDLQYYGCDGVNEVYLSDETGDGSNSGRYNQQGQYYQTNILKNQATSLAMAQAVDQQGMPKPFPANITLKFAVAIPNPGEAIGDICKSTDTTYIKSTQVSLNQATPSEVIITGSGDATSYKDGLVNTTYTGFGFDIAQQPHQILQNTTSQQPKFLLQSAAQPVPGAKICVNNVPTPVTINSSNQYSIYLVQDTSPVLSMISTDGITCQSAIGSLTTPLLQSNWTYSTNVIAIVPNTAFMSPNSFSILSKIYTPYQKGIFVSKAKPDPSSPQMTLYDSLDKVCIDDIVTGEVSPGSKFFLVSTHAHKIQVVNNTNQCDISSRVLDLDTPDNSLSYLTILNVHDASKPLNIVLSQPTTNLVQQQTIQSEVSTPIMVNGGTINSLDDTTTYKLLLERDISGNLSLKDATTDTQSQDILTVSIKVGQGSAWINPTATYKPILNTVDLTEGGAGLPVNGKQVTQPFELILNPKPASLKEVSVSFQPIARKLDPVMLKLKAYASNSPFVAYPVSQQGNIFTTTIPNGFKQLALYETSDPVTTITGGLIRTGGVD
jgi:hypothetical protein